MDPQPKCTLQTHSWKLSADAWSAEWGGKVFEQQRDQGGKGSEGGHGITSFPGPKVGKRDRGRPGKPVGKDGKGGESSEYGNGGEYGEVGRVQGLTRVA